MTIKNIFTHLAMALIAILCSEPCVAQAQFDPVVSVALAANQADMVSGDFDLDGDVDLAVATALGVMILLNDSTGQFTSQTVVAAIPSEFLATGDVNGDGILDLVAATNTNVAGTYPVYVLFGSGNGLFAAAPALVLSLPTKSGRMALADLDGNGSCDLIVSQPLSNLVKVFLNSGTAPYYSVAASMSYGVSYSFGVSRPAAVAAIDYDGDGDVDLACANGHLVWNVVLLTNDGFGNFGSPGAFIQVANLIGQPGAIAAADVNGDGISDLVVTEETSSTVAVLRNLGSGLFSADHYSTTSSSSATLPEAVALADLDVDGDMDIVVANGTNIGTATEATLINDGLGFFAPSGTVSTGSNILPGAVVASSGVGIAKSIVLADFDLDGRPDKAYSGAATTQVATHRNTTPLIGTYPGTGGDLEFFSSVGNAASLGALSSGPLRDVKTCVYGDLVTFKVDSPGGSHFGLGIVLIAELFSSNAAPWPFYPGLSFSLNAFIVFDGNAYAFLNPHVLTPGGRTYSFYAPLLQPGTSFLLQALIISSSTANGIFDAADAHEFKY